MLSSHPTRFAHGLSVDSKPQASQLKILQSLFGNIFDDLLVEITRQELRVLSFSGDAKFVDEPVNAIERAGDKVTVKAIGKASRNCIGPGVELINPFKHDRSMISSYTYAEKILRHAFKSTCQGLFKASPRVIMHQLEKNEGGLTEIEQRVLTELASGAGAREVVVYQGDRINPGQETFETIKSRVNAA